MANTWCLRATERARSMCTPFPSRRALDAVRPRRDPGLQIIALEFTGDGSLYYGTVEHRDDLYVATLDPQTGKLGTPDLVRGVYQETAPDWSPDGRYLRLCGATRPE